jgi:RNA polymerase sigma-70 factor (ECF subfamily)
MTAGNRNDTELWELTRNDNRAAYEMLYRRYMKLVFAEIHKRILHQKDAEDLTQNIFLTLWEKRYQIELEGRFFSYLYRMIQNRVLNYFRDKTVPAAHLDAWEDTLMNAGQPIPFKTAELVDMELLIEEERSKLPPKMREVFELRYEKNMNNQEISEHLVISPNTVRNHLKEVRKRFTNAIRKTSFFLF